MGPEFLRGLLISFAALLGAVIGAGVGLAAGPWLIDEAFGYHIGPKYRLTLGAFGLIVWGGLAAATAAYGLDHDRPVRGTVAAGGRWLRKRRELAAVRANDPANVRRSFRRRVWLAAVLWLAAASAAIGTAYVQHFVLSEIVTWRIAVATYRQPDLLALSEQQRIDSLAQTAYHLLALQRKVFWLVTASVLLTLAAALTTLSVVTVGRRATSAELRHEIAAPGPLGRVPI